MVVWFSSDPHFGCKWWGNIGLCGSGREGSVHKADNDSARVRKVNGRHSSEKLPTQQQATTASLTPPNFRRLG